MTSLLAFRCLEVKYNFKLFDRDWIGPHLSNLCYHVCISFEIQTLHLSPVSMELTQLRQVVTEVRLNSVNLTTSPVIKREIPVAQSVDRPSKVTPDPVQLHLGSNHAAASGGRKKILAAPFKFAVCE